MSTTSLHSLPKLWSPSISARSKGWKEALPFNDVQQPSTWSKHLPKADYTFNSQPDFPPRQDIGSDNEAGGQPSPLCCWHLRLLKDAVWGTMPLSHINNLVKDNAAFMHQQSCQGQCCFHASTILSRIAQSSKPTGRSGSLVIMAGSSPRLGNLLLMTSLRQVFFGLLS